MVVEKAGRQVGAGRKVRWGRQEERREPGVCPGPSQLSLPLPGLMN